MPEITFVIEEQSQGFVATSDEHSMVTQGDTLEQLFENCREAVETGLDFVAVESATIHTVWPTVISAGEPLTLVVTYKQH